MFELNVFQSVTSFLWRCDPTRVMASSFLRFLDHTQRRTTVGRTPLDKWSVRRRDLYLATHNTHNRKISMPRAGFEPTISAGERPQTYALDRAATGTGSVCNISTLNTTTGLVERNAVCLYTEVQIWTKSFLQMPESSNSAPVRKSNLHSNVSLFAAAGVRV